MLANLCKTFLDFKRFSFFENHKDCGESKMIVGSQCILKTMNNVEYVFLRLGRAFLFFPFFRILFNPRKKKNVTVTPKIIPRQFAKLFDEICRKNQEFNLFWDRWAAENGPFKYLRRAVVCQVFADGVRAANPQQ